MPLASARWMWISPLGFVTRHRAALSGTDGRLHGFQRVKISGTDRCAKCHASPRCQRSMKGAWHCPLASFRSGCVEVCQAQAGDFESHHNLGGVIAGYQPPIDPPVLRVAPVARAGVALTVEPLLFQTRAVIEHIRSASPPHHSSIVTHEHKCMVNYAADNWLRVTTSLHQPDPLIPHLREGFLDCILFLARVPGAKRFASRRNSAGISQTHEPVLFCLHRCASTGVLVIPVGTVTPVVSQR